SLRAVLGLAAEGDSGARDTTAHRPWLPATLLGVATVAMSAAGIMGHLRNSLSPYEGAGLASGFVAVIAMLLLATYGLRKRAIRWVMAARRRRGAKRRRKAVGLSAWYSGHLVLGAVMLAAFWVHSGGSLGGPVTAALA